MSDRQDLRRAAPAPPGAAAAAAAKAYSDREVRRAEAAYPPVGRFVTTDGVRLHYLQEGAGRPVLCIHGVANTLHDFLPLAARLAGEFQVIAFDRPGHGYSERPAGRAAAVAAQAKLLRGAARALGVERPLLVGHSLGGAVALAWALEYPAEVAGLVLLAPAAYKLHGFHPLLEIGHMLASPVLGSALCATLAVPLGRPVTRRFLARIGRLDPLPEEYIRLAEALWMRPASLRATAKDGIALSAGLRAMAPHYGSLTVPTTIVAGERDRVLHPQEHAFPLHQAIAGSVLVTLPRTGHELPMTRPDAVADAVRETVLRVDALAG